MESNHKNGCLRLLAFGITPKWSEWQDSNLHNFVSKTNRQPLSPHSDKYIQFIRRARIIMYATAFFRRMQSTANWWMAGILGIEPRLRGSKPPLLPLQHIPIKFFSNVTLITHTTIRIKPVPTEMVAYVGIEPTQCEAQLIYSERHVLSDIISHIVLIWKVFRNVGLGSS